jgi:alpha-glucosidase
LAKESARSGEPIVRSMEYSFPNRRFGNIKDQFMLGEKYMVAPIVKNVYNRKVIFPVGTWKGDDGNLINGPAIKDIEVPLDRLPIFELINK